MTFALVRLMVAHIAERGMNRSSVNPMLGNSEMGQIIRATRISVLPVGTPANLPTAI
jgi:hypothetical protein